MSMTRWTPFEEMEQLKRQIDTIFTPSVIAQMEKNNDAKFVPPVEVVEAEASYRVRFMIPDIDPAEVHLEATAKTLTVTGESASKPLVENERILISQFRIGKFSKQLGFPDGIDPDKIEATYQNGILEVVVPKALASQKRQIDIKTL